MSTKVHLQHPKELLANIKRLRDHCEKKQAEEIDADDKETYEFYLQEINNYIDKTAEYLDFVSGFSKKRIELKAKCNDAAQYREEFEDFDRNRSLAHTSCIMHLVMLDRCAKREGLPPVYGGFGEYEKNTAELTGPKNKMSEAARIKRREIGNVAIYFAAYYTAGVFIERGEKIVEEYAEGNDVQAAEEVNSVLDEIKTGKHSAHGIHSIGDLLHDVTDIHHHKNKTGTER